MDKRHKGRERKYSTEMENRQRIPQIIINKSIYISRNFLQFIRAFRWMEEEEVWARVFLLTRWSCSLKDYWTSFPPLSQRCCDCDERGSSCIASATCSSCWCRTDNAIKVRYSSAGRRHRCPDRIDSGRSIRRRAVFCWRDEGMTQL